MSTSISPSVDLSFRPELCELTAPFTSFRTGHFVKPAVSAQPVVEQLLSFEGAYTDMYACEGLDLDYDEPNAVVENEMEFIMAGDAIQQVELPIEIPAASAPVVEAPISQREAA